MQVCSKIIIRVTILTVYLTLFVLLLPGCGKDKIEKLEDNNVLLQDQVKELHKENLYLKAQVESLKADIAKAGRKTETSQPVPQPTPEYNETEEKPNIRKFESCSMRNHSWRTEWHGSSIVAIHDFEVRNDTDKYFHTIGIIVRYGPNCDLFGSRRINKDFPPNEWVTFKDVEMAFVSLDTSTASIDLIPW